LISVPGTGQFAGSKGGTMKLPINLPIGDWYNLSYF